MRILPAVLLSAVLLSGPAWAQDEHAPPPGEGASDDVPLAIPFGEEATAPASAPQAPQTGPLAIPGNGRPVRPDPMSPEKLAALRTYEAERLEIRGETEVRAGAVPVVGWGWGWGWGPRPGWRHHTTIGVAYAPVATTRGWGIYQGPQRLNVPTALSLAGDSRLEGLQTAIQRKKTAANAWYTVAGVGGAALVGSVFGRVTADSRDEYNTWYSVGLLGGATGIVGLIAASGPASEARSLEQVPYLTLSLEDARAVVERHNDALRQRLGLSPAEVWSIESRGR